MHGDAGTADVSPHASTVPLAEDDRRTTDGLTQKEERVSPQTSRVSLAEMERLLRAQDDAPPAPPADPAPTPHSSAATRPDAPVPDFDEELTITVPRAPQTRETGDFEATLDFEATRPAHLEATRPPSSTRPHTQHATRDAPSYGAGDEDAAPVGSWPYGAAEGDARPEAAAEATDGAAAGSTHANAGGPPGARTGAGAAGARVTPAGRSWPKVVAVCAAVAVLAAGGAWLAFSLLRRPAVTEVPTLQPSAPPPTADARQQFDEKLAEAEALLAGGDMEGALGRLREANLLDPANTRAHRRLAELLLSTGARREAIEELRAVARNAPDDFAAWRQLAAAQAAEGLHREAADSYRRLLALVGEQAADPADLLAYGDALRLSGRADESRAVYERLASAAPAELAAAARQRLAELARAVPTPTPTQQAGAQQPAEPQPPGSGETASATQPAAQPTPAQPTQPPAQPTPQPAPARPASGSPVEHYSRGVQLWGSNRGAALEEFRVAASGGNHDAHYYLGLAYVEGRSLSSLKRAEVVAALQHFQLAQRGGRHAAQARGHAQQLEKEFDRLRNK